MSAFKEFTEPVEGECICQYTFKYKLGKDINSVIIFLLTLAITVNFHEYLIKPFIPETIQWLEILIGIFEFIATLIIWYRLNTIFDKSYNDEKNIYYSSYGLFYSIEGISYTKMRKTYLPTLMGKLEYEKIVGLVNGELRINNRNYKIAKKYLGNEERLVEFLNKKQQEWLLKAIDEYNQKKSIVLQKAIEDGIENPMFSDLASDPKDEYHKGIYFRVWDGNGRKPAYYSIIDGVCNSLSEDFAKSYFS
jgi:hypothetical protein